MGESREEILGCMGSGVGGRDAGHVTVMGEELGSGAHSNAVGGRYKETVASIVFQSRAKVPGFFAVWGPTLAGVRILE